MVSERRRRKKARIDVSDTESSDSSEGSVSREAAVEKEPSASESSEDESDTGFAEETVMETGTAAPEEQARLRLHDTAAPSEDFNQYLLGVATTEFGEELEKLRQSTDFRPGSLELLVAGLKQGANIFSPEQRRLILETRSQ